jgi:TatD DNase family protein
MIIDSHCHLDYEPLCEDIPAVISRAKKVGVHAFLTISTKLSEFEKVKAVAEAHNNVFCSVGLHPHNAGTEPTWSVEKFVEATSHPKVIGIGEAGLDYFYNYAPREKQAESFRAQIAASRETKLPIIIHTRDADNDTATLLEDEYKKGPFPILLHCFTGGADLAKRGLAIGAYISFSGILTYKTAENLRKIARDVPHDRVLIETDSPYLAPIPHRGKKNEPSYIVHTAEALGEVLGLSLDKVGRQTTENFLRLFNKAKLTA